MFEAAQDWGFLLAYAKDHLVLPAMGHTLAASPASGAVPSAVKEALTEVAVHNQVQNQVLLADLAEAVSALEGAGIRSIVLKGAGLMARSPELVRRRQTDDIDLWVDPLRVFDADRVLRGRGYDDLAPSPHQPLLYDGTPSPLTTHSHQLPGILSPRGTPMEIHRHPPTESRARWDEALATADYADVRGVRIAVRSGPAMLRDLCTHVVFHHGALPSLWPRHLADAAALEEREPDVALRAAAGARPMERLALAATSHVLRDVRFGAEGLWARRLVFPRAGSSPGAGSACWRAWGAGARRAASDGASALAFRSVPEGSRGSTLPRVA